MAATTEGLAPMCSHSGRARRGCWGVGGGLLALLGRGLHLALRVWT